MAELKIFDRFEHYNHFHPESGGISVSLFPTSSLPFQSQLHRENRHDDPGYETDEDRSIRQTEPPTPDVTVLY